MVELVPGLHNRGTDNPVRLGWLVAAGAVLLISASMLHVSEVSRAVGVVLFALGVAALTSATAVKIAGVWPGRAWSVVVAVLLALLALYGVATWIYAIRHPPVAL